MDWNECSEISLRIFTQIWCTIHSRQYIMMTLQYKTERRIKNVPKINRISHTRISKPQIHRKQHDDNQNRSTVTTKLTLERQQCSKIVKDRSNKRHRKLNNTKLNCRLMATSSLLHEIKTKLPAPCEVQEFKHEPGLYFEKIGTMKQIETTWKLVIEIDVAAINRRVLQEYIEHTEKMCKQTN